ncbi:MAG: TRAP transporter large permease [Dehalobacterium sp.]
MEAFMLFFLLMVFIFIGVPIGIAIGVATLAALVLYTDIPLVLITQNCFAGVDSFPLMAVPFFILAGNLMSTGGVAKRIMDFATVCVGAVTGGLAMVTTVACMFFAAISGSAVATTSAIGAFMIPEMERKNYDRGFSAALAAAGGCIGIIIPPSIPLVIYGVVAQESIGDLFIAGIVPGILFGIALMVASYIMSKKHGYTGTGEFPKVKDVFVSFKNSFWAILAPVIVLGGIYSGIFTPTESAVIAVVYSLLVGAFIYKEFTWNGIYRALYDTMVINGACMFMIGLSMAFANYLSLQQVPASIASALLSISDNPIILMLLINVFLLLVGCLVDIIPAVIILTPVILPVAKTLGMDPITFGVMLVANLAIGFVTPPYGPNLFVAAAVANIKMEPMIKYAKWFILAMFAVLLMVAYIPDLTMVFLK